MVDVSCSLHRPGISRPPPDVRDAMTRVLAALGALALMLPGCMPAVSPDAVESRREPAEPEALVEAATPPRSSETDRSGPLEVEVDGAAPGPVALALRPRAGRDDGMPHVERAGWSADGQTFAHCRRLPGIECTACRFVHRDGTTRARESGPGCGDRAVPLATLEAEVAELALAPATPRWRSGADVVLVVETREHEQTNAGQPRPMLKLGARRRDGGAPAWLLHVDPCQGCGTDQVCAASAHLDALALAPDGERLAVLIHERGSQGDDSLRVELLDTARVTAAALVPASQAAP